MSAILANGRLFSLLALAMIIDVSVGPLRTDHLAKLRFVYNDLSHCLVDQVNKQF